MAAKPSLPNFSLSFSFSFSFSLSLSPFLPLFCAVRHNRDPPTEPLANIARSTPALGSDPHPFNAKAREPEQLSKQTILRETRSSRPPAPRRADLATSGAGGAGALGSSVLGPGSSPRGLRPFRLLGVVCRVRAGGGARHIRWVLFGRGVLDRLAELAGADLKVYIYGYQSRKTRPCRQKREQGNRPSTRIAAYRATRARSPPPARGLRSPVVQSYLKEKEKASSQGSLARSQGLGRIVGLLFLSWVEEGRQRTSALPSPERHGCRKCVSFELRYLRTATKALIVKDTTSTTKQPRSPHGIDRAPTLGRAARDVRTLAREGDKHVRQRRQRLVDGLSAGAASALRSRPRHPYPPRIPLTYPRRPASR